MARKYGPKAQEKVKETVKEYKPVAIGLDKARRQGAKAPKKN